MVHNISVPNTNDTIEWFGFLQKNRCVTVLAKESIEYVNISFNECRVFRPHHITTLACLIEEYHEFAIKIIFTDSNNLVCNYLKSLRFFEYWQGDIDRCEFVESTKTTALNLWKIKRESISAYAEKAKLYFEGNHLFGKDLDPISICLGEMFNNVFDHSRSKVDGYVLSQYYPKRKEVAIAVADFGVGIPVSVNNYFLAQDKDGFSDEEAIKWALKLGNTVQSQIKNKGFGLDTMRSSVKRMNSRMTIITGNTVYYHTKSGEELFHTIETEFPGTTVALFIDTKYLEENESIEEFLIF